MAVVSGEAGVGKSHLVRSLAFQVARRGGLPLVGHCFEFEGAVPYQAVLEMFRSAQELLRSAPLPAGYRTALVRLAPDVFGAAQSLEEALALDDLRARLFEAIWQVFLTLAWRQPMLLMFEDVHWADQSTLDWLTYVIPRLSPSRVLIILTYRTDEVSGKHTLARLERRFERESAFFKVPLQPLTRQSCRELVALLSGLEESSVISIADRLFIETGGNPFFLQEIAHAMIESGEIELKAGQWSGEVVAAAPASGLPLPDSLRATINARIERLSEITQAFLQTSAVAGRVFQYRIVQRAGGWADKDALDAVEQLLSRGFLHESEPAGTFAFAHHLVQEAIYSDLIAPRRSYLHQQIAGAAQALSPEDYEFLAYHFTQAGEAEPARIYSLRAGDRAQQLIALKDAAEHYRAALEHWPEADPAGRAETLYKLGQCQWVSMETQSALESFESARVLFERLGEFLKAGDTERVIGRLCWELGDREASRLHHLRALALLEQAPDTVELARALSSISQMHLVASEFDQAIEWGERALALAERLGADGVIVHALTNIGSSRVHVYEFDQERGLGMLQTSLRRSLTLGMAHDACRAYFDIGEDLAGLGRYKEAYAVYEELYVYARRVQALSFPGGAFRRLASLDWLCGRWAQVLDRWQELLKWALDGWGLWNARLIGRIYNDLGRAEIARLELERALPKVLKWGEIQITVPHLEQLARAYAALGLEMETRETIQQFLGLMDDNPYLDWGCTTPLLFACSWYASQPGMLAAAQACSTRLERANQQFHTPESRVALAEGQGILALAEGLPVAAIERLRQAAAGWEGIGRIYDQARALKSLGQALAVSGEAGASRLVCEQAGAILTGLAAQVEDPVLKQPFLHSQLFEEICSGCSSPK